MRGGHGVLRSAHLSVAGQGRLPNQDLSGSVSLNCKPRHFSFPRNSTSQRNFLQRNPDYSIRTDHTSSLSISRCYSVYNRISPLRSSHLHPLTAYSTQTRNSSHSRLLQASCLPNASALLGRQRRWPTGGGNILGSVRSCMAATNVNAAGKPLKDNTPAPKSASVVVVGGGSLGCSVLYHLAKLGVTDTVLVEANQLTAGEWRGSIFAATGQGRLACCSKFSLSR